MPCEGAIVSADAGAPIPSADGAGAGTASHRIALPASAPAGLTSTSVKSSRRVAVASGTSRVGAGAPTFVGAARDGGSDGKADKVGTEGGVTDIRWNSAFVSCSV